MIHNRDAEGIKDAGGPGCKGPGWEGPFSLGWDGRDCLGPYSLSPSTIKLWDDV